ncbi:MAG: PEP-CTERM sorting domain-containing protein [Verrucomicrobiota bacterium]
MRTTARAAAIFILAIFLCSRVASAVVIGQQDDFQNLSTSNWDNGEIIGTTAPMVVPTGGPAGAGDAFLRITSDGSGSGGKLTVWNREQWLGNYIAAGVTSIEVDLRNSSAVALTIRLAFKTGPGNAASGFLSLPMNLAVGSGWQHFSISLDPANLIPVGNPGPWSTFFIGEVRFIHAPGTGSLSGTPVIGQLDLDNIRAVPEPTAFALLAIGFVAIAGHFLRRKAFARSSRS